MINRSNHTIDFCPVLESKHDLFHYKKQKNLHEIDWICYKYIHLRSKNKLAVLDSRNIITRIDIYYQIQCHSPITRWHVWNSIQKIVPCRFHRYRKEKSLVQSKRNRTVWLYWIQSMSFLIPDDEKWTFFYRGEIHSNEQTPSRLSYVPRRPYGVLYCLTNLPHKKTHWNGKVAFRTMNRAQSFVLKLK